MLFVTWMKDDTRNVNHGSQYVYRFTAFTYVVIKQWPNFRTKSWELEFYLNTDNYDDGNI